MNEFLEENFSYLVTMTSIIYCMLGFFLIFFNTPQTSIYAPYRKSKRLLATGMFMIYGSGLPASTECGHTHTIGR